MNKKIIILGLIVMTNLINSMDFSSLGKQEGHNSFKRNALVSGLRIEDCHANKEAVIAEFFLQTRMNNIGLVKHFLNLGIDPNVVDSYGDTALIIAIQYNARGVVELLLQSGADPLQLYIDPSGNMPLERYVELFHSDYSELLGHYIRLKYAPSAPLAEEYANTEGLPDQDNVLLPQSVQIQADCPTRLTNASYISKLKSLVMNNKIISGVTVAIIAGAAYRYSCKKEINKNQPTA